MYSILSGTRLSRRAIDANRLCSRYLKQTRAVSLGAGRVHRGSALYQNLSKRNYATEDENPDGQNQSIDDIRLQNEFEETKDIRSYLQKWQEINSNELDPVRGPGTTNSMEPSTPWVGNMMSDAREGHDASSEAVRASDEDLAEFTSHYDEGRGINEFLEPGDLVALSATEGVLGFAIYVRSVNKQQQFYTERGNWRIAYSKDLNYVIKGFAPKELVDPLLPYFPENSAHLSSDMQSAIEGGVPRPIGAPLLRKIGAFNQEVQEFFRANTTALDTLHEQVADPEEKLALTLEEIACKALGLEESELNDVVLFAVHKAVLQHPFLIENDRSSLFTNHYMIQPQRIVETIDTVTSWVHEHQDFLVRGATSKEMSGLKDHPLHQFIQKAQRLIRLSRRVRSPTKMANVGPTSQRFKPGQDGKPMVYREALTEKFTVSDQKIIEFLLLWIIPPRRMTSGLLRSAGSHIMRATGLYASLEFNAASAPLFLQELGAISPWENLRLLDQTLALPGHGISRRSDEAWAAVEQACEELSTSDITDIMKDTRKDWGDLPVYCVDDVNAQEIDDGVSLEPIPGSDDTFWIRVHIANPSSFIPADGLIMKYAASRGQTLYVPERTYPMLPTSLTQGHFSLAKGRPTLTFSAKINLQGDVLETDISNGTINNVIYITHDKLRSIFEPPQPSTTLTVGGEYTPPPSRTMQETLSSSDINAFKTMRQLMLSFREHRLNNGAMDYPNPPDNSVSIITGTVPMKPSDMHVSEGRYFIGDPIIQLRQRSIDPHEVADMTKQNLISTLMNFACWISASWCAERNIPAVYDGTWYHPEYKQLTNENMSEYGGRKWLSLSAPRGVSSSTPLHHAPLGLDAYVKSTSPLRRFIDLIAHYQIEAALRYEHTHNRPFNALETDSILPFPKPTIEKHITTSRWLTNRIREIDRTSKQFWACMFLFRAFYFAECALPEFFPAILQQPFSNTSLAGTQFGEGYAGVMTELGVKCQVIIPDGMEVDILSFVEGSIVGVDLARAVVVLEATRVVKHFERVGEWA